MLIACLPFFAVFDVVTVVYVASCFCLPPGGNADNVDNVDNVVYVVYVVYVPPVFASRREATRTT